MVKHPSVCAVVPTYDNPQTVRSVVERIAGHGLAVVLVDDGSGSEGRDACEALAADGAVELVRLEHNQGKAAACVEGMARARALGYERAFQIDADGQHDLNAIGPFLEASDGQPAALVIGYPVYDESAPPARRIGRRFMSLWVGLEVGRGRIRDAMIGFRVYPIDATLGLPRHGHRMQFDPEVAVRLVRGGVPAVNLPVAVRYLTSEEGGVSHFRGLKDNLAYGAMHSRLCIEGSLGWIRRTLTAPLRRSRRGSSPAAESAQGAHPSPAAPPAEGESR